MEEQFVLMRVESKVEAHGQLMVCTHDWQFEVTSLVPKCQPMLSIKNLISNQSL